MSNFSISNINFTKICFALILVLWLAACDLHGKHAISWDQTKKFGFSHKKTLNLGNMLLIDYYLFDNFPKQDNNPAFPTPEKFKQYAALLEAYTPIANLQGVDREGSGFREFYGHVWRDKSVNSTIVISIRGTSDIQEWIDDVEFEMVDYSDNPQDGHVELGFSEIFSSFTVSQPDKVSQPNKVSQPAVSEFTALNDYLNSLDDIKKIIVTGHSLGSSLATLVAFHASENLDANVQLLTFASPLTGDAKFVKAFQNNIPDSIRIVNEPDLVPRVPLRSFGYRHVWRELEISSYSKPGIVNSVACYHSLNTYLHLLDESVGLEKKCIKDIPIN